MSTYQRKQRQKDSGNGAGPMLTMREACRLLNVHGNTLRRWSEMGLIKAYRVGIGQHRRFKTEDIAALVVEQTKLEASDPGKRR
jgi:excisionase family DNA binding protein